MLKDRYTATRSWIARHPRRFLVLSLGSVVAIFLLVQLLYPASSLTPFSSIDHVNVGGWSKEHVIQTLDQQFEVAQVAVVFNDSSSVFLKATPAELGITTSNKERIEGLSYPLILRLIPTSLLWAHIFTDTFVAKLEYERNQETLSSYITTTFGDTCHLEMKNASLEVQNGAVNVIEARSGGDCSFDELKAELTTVEPTTMGAAVAISGNEVVPVLTTKMAQKFADHVIDATDGGVKVNDGKIKYPIDQATLLSWIDFSVADGKFDYLFNVDRAKAYLDEKIGTVVAKPAGTTVVTMKDFAESERKEGQSGVAFNESAMLTSIKKSLEKGEDVVAIEVDVLSPTIEYNRTYSSTDTGLSALIKNYADTHAGTYGVSLRELSGARRNASYRADTQYTTASTYKLFVAYSTLLRIESGAWHWTDQINAGRDASECFDDMIMNSDNECAVAFLRKIGYKGVTDDAQAIGCKNTSFLGSNGIKSTASDETLFLGLLQSGQILGQQSSRDKLIYAMKHNVYRQGIPKGLPSATVADKVGFLDGWLHDASIVYTSGGDTYALVIMTENASWANIAELAAQIETLRAK
ncbi:MAG: serine hydrolase [Candidatus Microsaccharimonas sp.]